MGRRLKERIKRKIATCVLFLVRYTGLNKLIKQS